MTHDAATEVRGFVAYFERQIQRVDALRERTEEGSEEPPVLLQKILYISILDALSRAPFLRAKPRERMVGFLLQFSSWGPDAERVSLPHLKRLLALVPDPAFESLRRFVHEALAAWPDSGDIQLSQDPDLGAVRKLWPREPQYQKPIGGELTLEFLQHTNLFYRYRNSLVHEYRQSGYGFDFGIAVQQEPYYEIHTVADGDATYTSYELTYPVGFLKRLCKDGLARLDEYLTTNGLDPRDYYDFGSYWIGELNP